MAWMSSDQSSAVSHRRVAFLATMLAMTVVSSCIVVCSEAARSLHPFRQYAVRFEGNQSIETFDGNVLHADGYFPIPTNNSQRFPLLVFPNSWACPQIEYILKALSFAEMGFITLEYETRGWYLSGGQIDVAGPLDRRDITSVLDYAVAHAEAWHLNVSAIAMVGVSYGAGLTLEAAGTEPRLAAAVSLSGWGNLTKALYSFDTPNKAWADLLEVAADLLGHPQPSLATMLNDLMTHRNISAIEAYAAERSAAVNMSFINARRIPLFVSNNFLDRLFQPNVMVDFWLAVEGPKFLLLNQGMHAEAELFGLLDIPNNYVWEKVVMWLQQFLQGVDTGILSEMPIQMQVAYSGNDYIGLPQWPPSPNIVQATTYYLGNRAGSHYGQLQPSAPASRNGPLDVISYNELTGVYDGVPIVSDLFNEFVPTTNELAAYVESGAMVYMLDAPLASTTRYCGTPTYRIKFLPSSATWQLYTVLYDVDPFDVAEIISDAYFTSWGDASAGGSGAVGQHGVDVGANGTQTLQSSFHMMCRDVPAGHRLAVGVVLYNAMYTNPNKDFNVVFFYDAETYVELPYNPS